MIRLRYPNTTLCEMMFYRTSSARHYPTSLQHPCPLCVSLAAPLDYELQSALVLCLDLHVQPSWCSSAAMPRPLCPSSRAPHSQLCPNPQVCPAGLSGSSNLLTQPPVSRARAVPQLRWLQNCVSISLQIMGEGGFLWDRVQKYLLELLLDVSAPVTGRSGTVASCRAFLQECYIWYIS